MVCLICRRRRYRRLRCDEYALPSLRWSGRGRGGHRPGGGRERVPGPRPSAGITLLAGASSTARGRSLPAPARWIFVVSPPRERPRASSGRCWASRGTCAGLARRQCAGTSRVLVSAAHGGIRAHRRPVDTPFRVGVRLDRTQDLLPRAARGSAAAMTVAHHLPRPEARGGSRHAAPFRSRKRIASTTVRWRFPLPPRPTCSSRCGSSRDHSASPRSPRLTCLERSAHQHVPGPSGRPWISPARSATSAAWRRRSTCSLRKFARARSFTVPRLRCSLRKISAFERPQATTTRT